MTASADRPIGWKIALRELAKELRGSPFEWGETDCGSIARRALEVITGEAVLPDVEYRSARKAGRLQQELGGLAGALEKAGCRPVRPNFAQPGDLVVSEDDGREGIYVLTGGGVLTSNHDQGVLWLSTVPRFSSSGTVWRPPGGSDVGVIDG